MARAAASNRRFSRAGGGTPASRRTRACAGLAAASVLATAGCGGPPRQDVDEPSGRYPVEVVRAEFPEEQKLAKRSRMEIAVRNVGREPIPNLAVTVSSFDYREEPDKVEDPRKPIFIVNAAPRGAETAYVDTWALGTLGPGDTKTFAWDVTAVKARSYDIKYRVSAGLDGEAKAVRADGGSPSGRFSGRVSDATPQSKVADSGEDVIRAGERIEPRSP